MKKARITWYDAIACSGWRSKKYVSSLKLPKINTIGWVIKEDKEAVWVSHSVDPIMSDETDDWCNGYIAIPRGMISKISYFRWLSPALHIV